MIVLVVNLKAFRPFLLTIVISLFCSISSNLISQEEAQNQTEPVSQQQSVPPRESWGRVIEDEVEVDRQIQQRRPERDLVPRTETEEIVFSLNFLRQKFLESNNKLY